jgi:hypothetical protein
LARTQGMRNADAITTDVEANNTTSATLHAPALTVSFSSLFDALVSRLHERTTLLLMYNLLVHCPTFLDTTLVRSDIDALLVPLLKQLYNTTTTQAHHLYLLQVREVTLFQIHAVTLLLVAAESSTCHV